MQVGAHNKKSPLRQQCDSFMKLDYPIFLPHQPPRHHTISYCRLLFIAGEDSIFLCRDNELSARQQRLLSFWPAALAVLVQSTVVVLHNYRHPAHSVFHVWVKGEASPSETASPLLVVTLFIPEVSVVLVSCRSRGWNDYACTNNMLTMGTANATGE